MTRTEEIEQYIKRAARNADQMTESAMVIGTTVCSGPDVDIDSSVRWWHRVFGHPRDKIYFRNCKGGQLYQWFCRCGELYVYPLHPPTGWPKDWSSAIEIYKETGIVVK